MTFAAREEVLVPAVREAGFFAGAFPVTAYEHTPYISYCLSSRNTAKLPSSQSRACSRLQSSSAGLPSSQVPS